MTELTLAQLELWYNRELEKKSQDFRKKAEKSYRNVDRALKDVQAVATELREASAEDEDQESVGIAVRFALKIDSVVEDFDVSQEISYESTEQMMEEIQHFIQELWGAGARWIRRMDKKHKGTIKQLDDYMKELSKELKIIGKLLYEYSWVQDLERTAERIQTLRELTFSKDILEEDIRQTKMKIKQAEEDYLAAKRELEKFKSESNVSEVLSLDEESEHIGSVLRMKLNTLKKPIKKFLQHDTGVRVSPSGQKALTDYFNDPFEAIVEEPDGCPGLLEGLEAMETAIERDAFPLKDRLARRAIEEIELIKKGELQEYQDKAKEIDRKRKEYAGSEIYRKTEELEGMVREAEKNVQYHNNDLLRIRDDIKKQLEKAEDFKKRIEAEIAKNLGKKVTIDLGVTLEPLLKECVINLPEGVGSEDTRDV